MNCCYQFGNIHNTQLLRCLSRMFSDRLPARDALSWNCIVAVLFFSFGFVASPTVQGDESKTKQWTFEAEDSSVGKSHGNVVRDQEGPRPPEYPDFAASNHAIRLDRGGAYISLEDPGDQSFYDFTVGDAITLEAWVNPTVPGDGSPMVVIGKGRHGHKQFSTDNQNWALRLVGNQGEYKLNFLFSSGVKPGQGGDKHWHRWTSNIAFVHGTGWHHIAVSYQFGKPESIQGWIDGQPTTGTWDMGGATTLGPVVDNDEVRISSGNQGNQFIGYLDDVSVHRFAMNDQDIAAKFNRLGGPRTATLAAEVAPAAPEPPANKVLVTLHERMPKNDRWYYQGEEEPAVSFQWEEPYLFLSRIPVKFDDWGLRDDWNAPVLMKLTCDAVVPPGKHKIWMRVRGLSRLWADGELIGRAGPVVRVVRDGEQLVSPVNEPPLPGYRPAGYHQQELQLDWEVKEPTGEVGRSNVRRLILETVVGGPSKRTETGEILIALQLEGSQEIHLIGAGEQTPVLLKDEAVQPVVQDTLARIEKLETEARRAASLSKDAYWAKRHEFARDIILKKNQALQSPSVPNVRDLKTFASQSKNPIDLFVAAKKEMAWNRAKDVDREQAVAFHENVLPILREHCFRCHGEKANGALRIDSLDGILLAGESGQLAVVPGKPEESELILQIRSGAMPPTDAKLSETQIETLENWIRDGANWPAKPLPTDFADQGKLVDDRSFLRRVYLDIVGVLPTELELHAFIADASNDKRESLVASLLNDPRAADNWMGFWQDLLAENPTLINQSIGSTGPFRWYLYDALRDGKSVDRMVTELVAMRGSSQTGGTAAFALAGETDSPMAAKGGILASAFLGVETQCARCHDSPYHSSTQKELYSLAAMLDRKSVKVPVTSRVPEAFFEKKGRESLIRVTLKPDEAIEPDWPFQSIRGFECSPIDPMANTLSLKELQQWLSDPKDTREQFALFITSPHNTRFPQVFANRLWKRLIGTGIVEPIDDWEGKQASHPELLEWLGNEFISSGYDWKHLTQLILTSELYAKESVNSNSVAAPEDRYFHGPDRRRLAAEQIVDSLHYALDKDFDSEELTFVHDGQRTIGQRQTLGVPYRSWMFTSLNNERDRPSLALPRAAVIVDVLEAFGWTGSRQRPISYRDETPNVLQPGILANGAMVRNLVRVTYGSTLSDTAIKAQTAEELVEHWFARILGRPASPSELKAFSTILDDGFATRIANANAPRPEKRPELPQVTWFNHLRPETTTIQMEHEKRVEEGPSPDPRLNIEWREAYEDFLWTLVNDPTFVWYP